MMKQRVYLISLLVLIFIAWEKPILYPLKLLVVFFHESSHALTTLLTGGEVEELVINPEQGGHVISIGGNDFIIASSGYLGSLFWGVAIYTASIRTNYNKVIMMMLGLGIILITWLFSLDFFSQLFAWATGCAMLLSAKYLADPYNNFILRLIGLTSMMYVPLDIYSDTIDRSYLHSDAYLLAEYVGGHTLLWGSLWILISLVVIIRCLKQSLKQPF